MKPEVLSGPASLSLPDRQAGGRQDFPNECTATGIGSLPHRDPQAAARLVLKIFPELPFWPQLPCRSPAERMTKQFGLPVLNQENAAGFFELIQALQRQRPAQLRGIKGQITGPVTWLAANYFKSGEALLDEVGKNIEANAAWQIEQLRQFNVPVMVFLDEPALGKLSRYSSLSEAVLIRTWTGIVSAIHEAGGLAGIHCCDRMDWGLLFRCPVDLISFDAALSFQDLISHAGQLGEFIARGGRLSWGAIPTTDMDGDPGRDLREFEKNIRQLGEIGLDPQRVVRQSIITPACGLALASHRTADVILQRAAVLANSLKNRTFAVPDRKNLVRTAS